MKRQKAVEIKRILIVFKTHLDVGFTDFADAVRTRYLRQYLPMAIDLGERIRERTNSLSFVWTSGSWLISEALDTYKGKQLRRLEKAISHGHIAWHALPFTMHSELMDEALFRFGLSLSKKLDARFGKKTIAAKMTDVPGHTRSIVPLLAEAGVRLLHIGVNPASTAPDVPAAFVWRCPEGAELTVLYDHDGYGGVTLLPGLSCGLILAHTGDNHGPPELSMVEKTTDNYKHAYPSALVRSGRLDEYALELDRVRESLPVVTDEIGDTWIHGLASDPGKVARFRELQRLNSIWQCSRHNPATNRKLDAFRRCLLMVPEHTWGMDVKTHLADCTRYSNTALKRLRRSQACKRLELSWMEQRRYLQQAVDQLKNSRFHGEAVSALESLRALSPDMNGFERVPASRRVNTCRFSIGFDDQTGDICHLKDLVHGRTWATRTMPIAGFSYEVFSGVDYERFSRQYLRDWPNVKNWAIRDFTKPGIEACPLEHETIRPSLKTIWHKTTLSGDACFVLQMRMPRSSIKNVGAPSELIEEIHVHAEYPAIDIVFQWFGKHACRLPEASWMSFCPPVGDPSGWAMRKMGYWISPLEIVHNGNRKLHAVEMVRYHERDAFAQIESLDAPLVAPGRPSLLDHNNRRPPLRRGMHFNLHNNVWGTNFPMWYEEDARFRFRLVLEQPAKTGRHA